MNRLSQRERLLLLVGAGVAVLIIASGLLTPPDVGRSGPAAVRGKREALQAELRLVREEIAGLQQGVDARLSHRPPQQLVREMIQAAQDAARRSGLRLDDLQPSPPESVSGIRRVPVQVSLSAPFPRVARFLYELQGRRDRYRVDHLRMSAAGAESDRLSVELRLVAYVSAEEEADDAPGS